MIRYAPIFPAYETLLQLYNGITQGSIGNMPKRTKNTTTDLVFLFIKKKNPDDHSCFLAYHPPLTRN